MAGSFYPAEPDRLAAMVRRLLETARRLPGGANPSPTPPVGLLVPHAGLVFSGVVAAAGWSRVVDDVIATDAKPGRRTVVILGTNHGAAWLDGVAAWDAGAWRTPVGDLDVDEELAAAIVALGPPFRVDGAAHEGEHSIEVQLPLLRAAAPDAQIVPLSVSAGVGRLAIEAGARLGRLLATRLAAGASICLAISSDMAH
ncbi:MAG TPA: AmmeMemoRadiSam system protein B, partial [Candidatus Limnocylindrales bacterium]|nr:AmmeMemoRadiSam system protein B [Candidatus Limnocylindrales bacterium]